MVITLMAFETCLRAGGDSNIFKGDVFAVAFWLMALFSPDIVEEFGEKEGVAAVDYLVDLLDGAVNCISAHPWRVGGM